MKKRLLSMMLAMVMLIGLVPVTAMAADIPTISATVVDGEAAKNPGDTITVTVDIANNPGCFTYGIVFDCGDNLTYTGVTKGLGSASDNFLEKTVDGKVVGFTLMNYTAPVTGDGTLATLTFTVNEDVTEGNDIISFTVEDFTTATGTSLAGQVAGFEAEYTIAYKTSGLVFANGNEQNNLTYDQVKNEALGAEGAVALKTPGKGYLFAGWFTGLDVTADANGFCVIDPASDAEFAGTEFRPREGYDTPPTEGIYNALWIKDNGSTVLTVGDVNTIQVGTDDAAALTAAVAAANGTARVKLVENLAMTAQFIFANKFHLDVNGCTLSSTAASSFQTAGEDNTIESSRSGALIKGNGTVIDVYVDYTTWQDYGSFSLVRDVRVESDSQSNIVFATYHATTVQNCVFGGYVQFNSATGTSTIDNCTFESTGVVVVSAGETTITNTKLNATGSGVPFQGGFSGGTIKLGTGNNITVTNAANLCSNATKVYINATDSTYQIAETATVPFKGATNVSVVNDMQYGLVNGLLKFGNTSYTVTYKSDDGEETVDVLAGCPADLTKTVNYADTKYKHGGWALDSNSSEALTSYTVNENTTLYAVRLEAGVRLPNGTEITKAEHTYSMTRDTTDVTFGNANKLGDLNKLTIQEQKKDPSVTTKTWRSIYVTFLVDALDSIAGQVNSEATVRILHTYPSEGDGFVAKVDLSVTEGAKIINFNGAVEVEIEFVQETGKNYRVYYIDENGEAHGMPTTIITKSNKKYAKFTTDHFSTFELRETTVAEGYTAELDIAETEVRAGGKTVNVTVNVSHSSDTQYNAGEIVVDFDSDLLTFDKTNSTLPENATCKVDGGTLTIEFYGDVIYMPHAINLAFTTCESVDTQQTTTVTLTSAAFADSVDAQSEDLSAATLDPATDNVIIQLEAFDVEINTNEDDGDTEIDASTEAVKDQDYVFSVTKDEHYTYEVTATVGEGENAETVTVTESTTEPGKYTIAGDDVQGPIEITVVATANQYDVTITDENGETTKTEDAAAHDTDYKFNLPTKDQWQYKYAITIGGTKFENASESGTEVTIPGEYITGDIEITITGTQTEFNVTMDSEDASWTESGNGDGSVDLGESITVTIQPAEGYTYDVTAEQTNGEDLTVTKNDDGTYTISGFTSDITITVTKTLIGTVNVDLYLTLDATNTENPSLSMFLVTFDGELAEGYIPYCNNDAMYWSSQYNAYCYLVIDTNLETAKTNAQVSVKSGDKTEITYTFNVNGSTNTDAADAQLVYDMYQAEYKDFDTVGMLKFLLADVNNSRRVETEDAAKIISEILNPTTQG